jgi:hypothetical protein
MTTVNGEVIARFFDEAARRLTGDWVLIGGAVLAALGREIRVTLDIDFIPRDAQQGARILAVMESAEAAGLPIEAVNSAAVYFLEKIPDYAEHLRLLFDRGSFRVFRPDTSLFIRLKTRRMSEADLEDCLEFIRFARESGEFGEMPEVLELIRNELRNGDHRVERLTTLLGAIGDFR